MPTDDEEEDGEGVAQRQGVGGGLVETGDWPTTMPARNAPRAIDAPKT